MKNQWFFETLFPSVRLGLRVRRTLYRGRSPFQRMQVLETAQCGRVLVLDGVVQTTEYDEHIYHEMLTHVPLATHPNPKRVLVIGGGDGGILREALKYPIEGIWLVEIDEAVIEVSKRYLTSICRNAFRDQRVHVVVQDGAKFVRETPLTFDVVIIDSTDPKGPGRVLFETPFYRDVARAMTKHGVLVRQTGSTYFQPHELPESVHRARAVFRHVAPYLVAVPTYIGGFFSLLFASKTIDPRRVSSATLQRRIQRLGLRTRYYNPEVHRAAFSLPTVVQERVARNGR